MNTQDFRRKDHADCRKGHARRQAEGNGRMDRALEPFCLPRSVIPRHNDSGAHRNTIEKAYHQKDQIAGRTDRRKCVASEKISNDQGIRRVIKLLKKIAQEQWNGKENNLF